MENEQKYGDLENNHNVYILGAGFSVDAGLPQIKDFMYSMRDAHEWLVALDRLEEAKAIKSVLDFRLRAASAAYRIHLDLENIEELFSLASAATDELHRPIRTAIAATLDYRQTISRKLSCQFDARANLELPQHWDVKREAAGVKRYENIPLYEFYLAAILGRLGDEQKAPPKSTFISFNYDCLVEQALSSMGIPFSYGLQARANDTSAEPTHLKILDTSDIKVLKLHGSLNWAIPKGGRSLVRIYDDYDHLRKSGLVPELVPPTWRKLMGTQLTDVWRGALNAIGSATRLIVLGFSMPETDMHFKYLIAAGLQNNLSLRDIVFVNPAVDQMRTRADSLFSETTRKLTRLHLVPFGINRFLAQGSGHDVIGGFGRSMDSSVQSFMQT